MREIWTLGMALLAGIDAQAMECSVTAVLSNIAVAAPATLFQAKTVATQIFASIGVELRWKEGSGCTARVEVRLENESGPQVRPDSLAYTTLGPRGEGSAHILFDRVSSMVPKASAGMLLGHVLAHEITHILEGVPRHSGSGVMKEMWERKDLQSLVRQPLRFALVDEATIHAAVIHAGLARQPARAAGQATAATD